MGAGLQSARGATSRDVAALAGVAQSTVSLVINGGGVAPETRRRVEEAMRKLSYQPNAGARALRTARSRVIALVLNLGGQGDATETVPYIDTVVESAGSNDYDVVLSTPRDAAGSVIRLARSGVCDAFVMMDVESGDERVAAVAGLGLPAVLVGRPMDSRGLDVVDLDSWKAGELLVDELAESGHRRIAMLGAPGAAEGSYRFIHEFVAGARERARTHGIDFEVVHRRHDDWAGVLAVADQLLAQRGDRLGLIARAPRDAQWLMNLLQLKGLVPGRDLSVVACCTDDVALSFAYPITNISPRPVEVTSAAMRFLFERIDGSEEPSRIQLVEPTAVVRRATTVDFAASSTDIALPAI